MAKSFKIYPIFVTLALLLAGCADQSDPGLQQVTLYDVVEVAENAPGGSQFLLYHGDSDPVRLCSDLFIDDDDVTPGTSVFLAYIPECGAAYTSGPVDIKGVYPITNVSYVVEQPDELAAWDADPVYLMSIWRAGSKINVRCQLPVSDTTRRLALVADATTIDSPTPQLYLAHDLDDDRPTFDRNYYISFDISGLTNDPGYTGIDIHVNNSNLPVSVFHFDI